MIGQIVEDKGSSNGQKMVDRAAYSERMGEPACAPLWLGSFFSLFLPPLRAPQGGRG